MSEELTPEKRAMTLDDWTVCLREGIAGLFVDDGHLDRGLAKGIEGLCGSMLKGYGDQRAEQERERCAMLADTWEPDSGLAAAIRKTGEPT